jgi:lysozyme family protein
MAEFGPAVAKTIRHEGGAAVTDDPTDKGGLTKYGISQRAYPSVDIRNLTEEDAKEIYRRDYWDKVGGNEIRSQAVAETLFDFAVNAGAKTSVRICQDVLDLPADGVVGGVTIRRLNEADAVHFIAAFALGKIARYVAICRKNPEQKKFLYGWILRALEGTTA